MPSIAVLPDKFILLIPSLCADTRSRVRFYDDVSPEFTLGGGLCHGYILLPFLCNSGIEEVTEVALCSFKIIELDTVDGHKLFDCELTDDIAHPSEECRFDLVFDFLNIGLGMFVMHFSPKCKRRLQR